MSSPAYRIDGQSVSAAQFYARACDPSRSVVVEACAGAGKTWMLVSRVLLALLEGAQPQQILAITYTRKAAGEMRARLEEWLAAFSSAHSTVEEREQALQQRGMSAQQAREKADDLGALHAKLLQLGRPVEVRTFHAWFAQLLSHAPLSVIEQLGLPAAYELVEDTQILQSALLRRFHRRVQDDAERRADYLDLVRRHRRSTVLEWLQAAWRHGPELMRAEAAGTADSSVPPAAEFFPACAGVEHPAQLVREGPLARDIAALARQMGQLQGVTPRQKAAELVAAAGAPNAEESLRQVRAALLTTTGKPRKNLGDTPLQQAVLDGLTQLHDMQLQQDAHQDQLTLLRLARVLLQEYAALKRERGLIDMPDLERAAEALLGDSAIAGWVQERLDRRVRHVLIDEFQDTNPQQWQLLQSWLSSYAGAGGGASGQQPLSLFVVGDPKQSIYSFRGAEPRVFEAARDFTVEGLQGSVLACDHTRRNAPAVIDALNAVFNDAARVDGWGPFRDHTTDSSQPGQVLRLPGVQRPASAARAPEAVVWRDSLTQARTEPEQKLRAEEATQIASAVAALINEHQLAPGDVMVLARKRSMLALVAQALADAGIAHIVAEPLSLHESPEVLDLLAVLDVLASPGHDLSLARALRSPVFSATDEELLWLSQESAGQQLPWLATLLGEVEPVTPNLHRARRLLARWRTLSLPPHDLLDQIVSQADVIPRMAAAVPPARRQAALHAVNALLAASLQHEGGRFTSVYGLVRAVRSGRLRSPGVAPADAVQLLTVHGAKGLEARAVVVADAEPERRPALRADVLVDWPVDQRWPRAVAFVRNEDTMAPSLREVWSRVQQTQEREELNALYVAMTRARQWLVFSRTEPHQGVDGSRPWWPRVIDQAEAWHPSPKPEHALQQPLVEVPVLPAWEPPPPQPSAAVPPPEADGTLDESAARLGRAVHRVLEWACGPAGAGVRADLLGSGRVAALQQGMPLQHGARVARISEAILGSASCARFFDDEALRWAGNEVPLSWQGQSLRIDRLVALQDAPAGRVTWWVLDYKLQSDPASVAAYREQMGRYCAAVAALQPGDSVRGGFITGQGELVEV
jgi:ATP-dependent helicase/nuclease subunit A